MQLRQLVYVSAITPGLTKADERHIVGIAKRNNRRSALTGLIVSSGRHFLQVLEGPDDAVGAMVPMLLHDPRHRDVRMLVDRPVETRRYAGWSMGYVYSLDLGDALAALHVDNRAVDLDALLARLQPDDVGDSVFGRSGFGQFAPGT